MFERPTDSARRTQSLPVRTNRGRAREAVCPPPPLCQSVFVHLPHSLSNVSLQTLFLCSLTLIWTEDRTHRWSWGGGGDESVEINGLDDH